MESNIFGDMIKCNCFLADYSDKRGQDYNQAFCCLSYTGNIMQNARDIKKQLVEQGYIVTAICYVPGSWTPQQVEEMGQGKRPYPSGTTPLFADFEAIFNSCTKTAHNPSKSEPFASWLVSLYASKSWENSNCTADAYGENATELDNLRTLAHDVLRDLAFPFTSTDPAEIMQYFEKACACPQSLNAARTAVRMYEQLQKTQGCKPAAKK